MFEGALGKNHAISRVLIEELFRCGVDLVCISPGSRSTPLVLAAAEHTGLQKKVHVDERGAAFYAVGHARATGRPVALICTSGTAVANYLPAVVEASQSFIPLIVITADRPFELHDTRSNQTIKQRGIFGEFVRWECELPPFTEEVPPRALLSSLDYAIFCARRSPAGPVHINIQFRKPLVKQGEEIPSSWHQDLREWSESSAPLTNYLEVAGAFDGEGLTKLCGTIEASSRGVITVGELAPRDQLNPAFLRLARHLKWPLIADVSSGLRFILGGDGVSCHAAAYLEGADDLLSPDVILHFGGSLVSNSTNSFLEGGKNLIHIYDQSHRHDPFFKVKTRIVASPVSVAELLCEKTSPSPSSLLPLFSEMERAASTVIETSSFEQISEIEAVRAIVRDAPHSTALYLANSLPVREGDLWVGSNVNELVVGVHRGVSGIDGTLACAAGFAEGTRKLTTLIIGDLSFLHDLNSLLLVRESEEPIIIIVLNNDGGAIFSFLPTIPSLPCFERYFETPHGLHFEKAAALFSLPYYNPSSIEELRANYRSCVESNRSSVIELFTSKARTSEEHQDLKARINQAIAELKL